MSRLPLTFAATAPLLSASAQAQTTGFSGEQGSLLDRADLAQADPAAQSLLRPAAPGTPAAWAKPASSDSGLLTLQRARQSHGRDRRAVRRRDDFEPGTERTLLSETCLMPGQRRLV